MHVLQFGTRGTMKTLIEANDKIVPVGLILQYSNSDYLNHLLYTLQNLNGASYI